MLNYWAVGALARLLVWAGLLPLAGCATAYHREDLTGGYSDARLADTTYRVRFKGNNYTPRDRVESFLLYRCAEVAAQLGYDYFVLVSVDTLDISDPLAKAGVFPRNYYATALVRAFREPADPAAYNAHEVMGRLRAQYPGELGS